MALNSSGIQLGAAAIASGITYLSLHSGDPGASGTSNTTTAARQACSLSASGGNISLSSSVAFTGGAASGAVAYVGLWSASTAGTYYGSIALTGDAAFNSLGQYTVTALNFTGSAS